MNQLLSIVDDGLVIKKLSVQTLDGPIEANSDVRIQGITTLHNDLRAKHNVEVAGVLTVETLRVKNFISDNHPNTVSSPAVNPEIDFTFVGAEESNLDGQGLIWLDSKTGSKQFVYKEGNKLWSTMNIDLARDRAYQINKLNVLTTTELGSSVVKSSLRKVGELEGLKVSGQVEFDNYVFFNSYNNTVGINTDNPNATLGIVVDNNVEVIVGSKESNVATFGTFTSNTLDIITDNKTRISIKNNGEIIFGNPKFKNAIVKIHGRLEVDELITASDNTQSLNILKRFVKNNNTDKIVIHDSIDLVRDKWYNIDNSLVLSKTTLGTSVTESNLEKLGALRELTVNGTSIFNGTVNIPSLNSSQIISNTKFNVSVNGNEDFSIEPDGLITIGNTEDINRNIKLHGITNIIGHLTINNKRIINDSVAPVSGRWNHGDICYNTNPTMEGYIGWVCVQSGEPGKWCPFGLIMPVRS
jgi:hypothetical protein